MSDTATLQATVRDRLGSRYTRRIREAGGLPAIVYGHGQTPLPIQVDAHAALRQFHSGHKLFELKVEGQSSGEPDYVLLKDLQFDHMGTNIVHCDFARVNLDERIETRVSLSFIGDAKGLGSAGAIMMHPHEVLEIECLITNMPDQIEVDISDMDVGDILHAGDVKLPLDTMVLMTDPETIIAQIVVQVEVEAEGEEAEVDATGGEPEVLGEKKDDEDKSEG
jgi:large subunit ribosomal protein L25